MSSGQKHRIARQTIELLGCRQQDAAALQAAVAQRFESEWMPVLERVCSALGDARQVLRIDRLEIDLGAVTLQDLQAPSGGTGSVDGAGSPDASAPPLLSRLEVALRNGLARALPGAEAVSADHELLAFFLHSGALPWWADAADRAAVTNAIDALADAPPRVWRALLTGSDGQLSPDALQRLVAEGGAVRLSRLLARWRDGAGQAADATGWQAPMQPAWDAALGRLAERLSLPSHELRVAWWCQALSTGVSDQNASAEAWWRATLHRWAVALQRDAGPLRQALRQALDHPDEAFTWPAPLWRALADDATAAPAAPALLGAPDAVLYAALGRLSESGTTDADRWRRWRAAWPSAWAGLADAQRQRLTSALGQSSAEALAAALADALAPLATSDGGETPDADTTRRLAAAWARAALRQPSTPAAAPDRPVSPQADAVYVHNAGLVLLWPFVSRFVQRLNLLNPEPPQRFVDAAAAGRAARLLHLAISGDAEAPEHQLPLAKLMCGLPLEAPLPPMPPLADDELAEADALLQAVLAQAPGLGSVSVAGFRGSFGLREGQLTARDGHWLLRVERQTYDLLLDRLPWGFGIVRLPWMPRLLQVEW